MPEREANLVVILSIGHDTSRRGAGISLRDALARSRYRELRPTFEPADLVPLIQQNPDLCEEWLAYSQDKRTSGGWYLDEDGGVGRLVPKVIPQHFGSTDEAVANFVVRELDFWTSISD